MSNCFLTLLDGTSIDVMRGDLLFPYFGNWTAHLMLANAESAPSGICTLTCFDKNFAGFIYSARSSDSEGRFYCMVVGGNGGLSSDVPPQGYNYQVQVRLPLEGILSAVGETISPTAQTEFQSKIIPSWNRLGGSASVEVSRFIDLVGGVWRVAPDGGVFVGVDSFGQADEFEYIVLEQDPVHANVKLSLQTLGLLPGQRFPTSPYATLSNRKIGACQYIMMENSTTMRAWFLEESGVYTDPLHQGLELFVKEVMRGVDYFAQYPCRVVTQRVDGTIDIIPDSSKIPPMTSVPLRVPVPGCKIKVADNSRGNLVFEGGNPQGFAFHLYEMGAGGKKIARVDDKVTMGSILFSTVANGVLTGTYTDAFGAATTFTLGTPFNLSSGKITTGWPNLEVGSEV